MPSFVRREPRFPIAVSAVLTARGSTLDCVATNVSFDGALLDFSKSDDAHAGDTIASFRAGELVRLSLVLPGHDARFASAASILHVVRKPNRLACGVRLFGLGGAERATWDRFVDSVAHDILGSPSRGRSFSPLAGRAITLPVAQRFEPKKYRSTRHVAVLRIHVPSVGALYAMAEPGCRHIFVLTMETIEPGSEVGLQLVHPDSDEIFEAEASVSRSVNQHGIRGLELAFSSFDDARRARLREFIDDGLEALFDDESVVDEASTHDAPPTEASD